MITTERLVIRPFLENDYNDLFEYLSLKDTYRWEPGEPITLEKAKELCIERSKGTNFWAATLKESKKVIGHVFFSQIEPTFFMTWEIGFIFNPAFQNKGYATEAAHALIQYAFKELEAHRITAGCSPENIASWRVLEKCGLKREGYFKKKVFFRKDENGNPLWFDTCEYAVLAEDFL